MIIDEDVYLEHFGVKGMKWGVKKRQKFRTRVAQSRQRNANNYAQIAKKYPSYGSRNNAKVAQNKADRAKRWQQGKPTRGDRAHRALSAAAIVGLGGAAVAMMMSGGRGQTRMSSVPRTPKSSVEQMIRNEHKTQLSSLTRMHAEGKMDADQFKKFSESLAKRYDRKVMEALGQL